MNTLIEFLNYLGTIRSWFRNNNTAARTYTFPDKDGTVAMLDDVGGGAVDSVNGQTGVVVLDAADVGADPTGSAATVAGNLASHTGNTSNPHSTTAVQVGAYTSVEVDNLFAAKFGVDVTKFASIQLAVDSVTTGNDLYLYFPPGTYSIATPIVIANKGNVVITSFFAKLTNSLVSTGSMFDVDACLSMSVNGLFVNMNNNAVLTEAFNIKDITGTLRFTNVDIYNFGHEAAIGIRLENATKGTVQFNYGMPGANFVNCNFYNDLIIALPASFDYNNNNNKGIGIYAYDQAEYCKITNCGFNGINIALRLRSGANFMVSNCQFTACLAKQSASYGFGVITLEAGGTNGGKLQISNCTFNHNWLYCILSLYNVVSRPIHVSHCHFIASGFTPILFNDSNGTRNIVQGCFFDRANINVSAINSPVSAVPQRYIYTISSRNIVMNNTFLLGITGACVGSGTPADFNVVKDNNFESGLTVATLNGSNNQVLTNLTI